MEKCLLVLLVGGQLVSGTNDLKIGAFNVKDFSNKKMTNSTYRNILQSIVQRYDILLIQEVLHHRALEYLANLVRYSYSISDGFGTSRTRQEHYAFLYRNGVGVTINSTYQYPRYGNPGFERPPYCLLINSEKTDVRKLVLIPLHSKPEARRIGNRTVQEINGLVNVIASLPSKWERDNILILGDLNLDMPYVRPDDTVLLKNPEYKWWILDGQRTNLGRVAKAYDRIISKGRSLRAAVIHSGVYSINEVKEVSDHYPVEIFLKARTSCRQTRGQINPGQSATNTNLGPSATNSNPGLYATNDNQRRSRKRPKLCGTCCQN